MLDGPLLIISQAGVELVRVEGISDRCCHEIRNASAMRLVNVKRPGRRDETISVNALLALRGE